MGRGTSPGTARWHFVLCGAGQGMFGPTHLSSPLISPLCPYTCRVWQCRSGIVATRPRRLPPVRPRRLRVVSPLSSSPSTPAVFPVAPSPLLPPHCLPPSPLLPPCWSSPPVSLLFPRQPCPPVPSSPSASAMHPHRPPPRPAAAAATPPPQPPDSYPPPRPLHCQA